MTIDKRKNYYLTIDTETANGRDDCLSQFDGYEEANHYLNQLIDGTDIWDLEEIYKG